MVSKFLKRKQLKGGMKKETRAKELNLSHIVNSASKCTLQQYIEIVYRDNLKCLIVSGTATETELTQAKIDILQDFSLLTGSTVSSSLLSALNKLSVLKWQVLGLNIMLKSIQNNVIDDEVKKHAERNRITLTDDPEKNYKAVKRVINSLSGKIQEVTARIDKITSSSQKGEKSTEKDFMEQIAIVSKFMGFRIDPIVTYLSEFASYLSMYRQHVEAQAQQKISPQKPFTRTK